LILGDDTNPTQIRVELSCENDLFFHFTHEIDEESFKYIQENQKLCVGFKDYPNLNKKLFNNCINEPHRYDN